MKLDYIKNIINNANLEGRKVMLFFIKSRLSLYLLDIGFKVGDVSKIFNVNHATISFYRDKMKDFDISNFDSNVINKLDDLIDKINYILSCNTYYIICENKDGEYYAVSDWIPEYVIKFGDVKLNLDGC